MCLDVLNEWACVNRIIIIRHRKKLLCMYLSNIGRSRVVPVMPGHYPIKSEAQICTDGKK